MSESYRLLLDEERYRAALYVPDASMSTDVVADIVHEISHHSPQAGLDGLVYAGREWL